MNDPALLQHLEDLLTGSGLNSDMRILEQPGVKCEGGYCVVAGKPIIWLTGKIRDGAKF